MKLQDLAAQFMTPARAKALRSALRGQQSAAYGLAGSSAAVMLATMPQPAHPVLVVGDSLDDAGYLYYDLVRLCGEQAVAMLPSGYKRDIKYGQPDEPSRILRVEALQRIAAGSLRFIVSYPDALAERVASQADIAAHTLSLSLGAGADLTATQAWLRDNGFHEQDYVYEPGQFAVRGSILDIYAYNNELPYRLDFFGDEIDSIREFNVETQLSERKLDAISVTANVASGTGSDGLSLLGYIDPATLIAVRNPELLTGRIRAIAAETPAEAALIAEEGETDSLANVVDAERFAADFANFRHIELIAAPEIASGRRAAIAFDCSPQGIYHKNFDMIAESFGRLIAEGYSICILSDNEHQHERLRAIFADRGDDIPFTAVEGTLHEGFVDHATRLCVFTDHQIFDRFHKYTLKSDRARSGRMALSLKELGQIEPGDFIVHVDHGVGRFAGLLRTDVGGRTQEMIKLVYANNDIIFVSIHALHKLAKYRGKEGVPPKVNRIGSGTWNRLKERTKSKLTDIARDLIRLYAERKQQRGHAFAPDSYLQHELEASFIYEDTPDQLTATQAVKADMESDRPMDRLICGDVGFGKTEIAIRAAFKAATDGKQTAVLVPTTVLAYQHFQTFSRRLADFPVRVDYLSRARSPKETRAILDDLAEGRIDILIGTHKLIGKTVRFHDLGLLVV
ncbi:MAG: DEAD/DEAH box helicase, partial [Muribaculaceae bacterium]|nr:DEAD/DEAH box helicase [Muribaculaceae bacterium]